MLAAARSVSDLAPYVIAMAAGFLLGAWGQAAKVPVAVGLGILVVFLAVAAFVLSNNSGTCGVPGC